MASNLTEWVNNNLQTITHEAFKEVVKVSDPETKIMGDGTVILISDINRVTLTLEKADGQKKLLKAVAKIEPPPGPGKIFADMINAFETETAMYSDVLKKMETMLSEVGDKDIPWADCYLCGNKQFLFQDLCEDGYRIVPTYTFLDREHTLLVMKAIGKFHGLSVVLKEKNMLGETRFKEPLIAKDVPMFEAFFKSGTENLYECIRNNWGPEWSSIPERLEKYFGNPREKAYKLWKDTKGKWDVLNHGDFTIRNMLFHYPAGSKRPDGVKFVDFQTCHYSNFGFDVAMLLYSSVLPSVRDENMADFQSAYADSFAEICKKLHYKGSVPTTNDVNLTLKSLHIMTTQMILFSLPFGLHSKREDIQEKTDEFMEMMICPKDSETPPKVALLDFTNKEVEELVKSELKKCMEQHLF